MPPWKADPANGPFVGQHPLSDAEIALLAALGRTAARPKAIRAICRRPPRTWTEGWQLGKPDLVVTLPSRTRCRRTAPTSSASSCSRFPRDRARFVRGLEFRPGNPRVVHHANIRIDRTPASRRLDEAGSGAGLRRADRAFGGLSRRPFPRLDAGAGGAAAAEGSRVAPRAGHRPRRRAAHAAERQAGAGRAVDRPVLQRPAADADAGDAAARTAEHRHPAGDAQLHGRPTRTCCRWTSKCRRSSRTRTTARATCAARRRCPTARRRR